MEMFKINAAHPVDLHGQVHIWRSKFIDKCAKCEAQLRRLAQLDNSKKIHFKTLADELLSNAKKGKNTAQKSSQISDWISELLPLIDLRAELAHSHLLVEDQNSIGGTAAFQNANFTHTHFQRIILISADQRKHAYDRLAWITGQLTHLEAIT
jgi:hypothetical protein